MDRPQWMTREWLEDQKRKLMAERDRLRTEIDKGTEELATKGTPDPREPGDVAEEDRQDDEAAGTMEVSQSRFKEVEDAIARIDAGTYGRCVDCRGWVARDRLEALPTAPRCVPCQEAYEKRRARTPAGV